jgi:hypothetical protein
MAIPGYDPQDLEAELRREFEHGGLDEYLSEAERRRHERGEQLVDIMSADDITDVLGPDPKPSE